MSELQFRFAKVKDAEKFAQWVCNNPDVPLKDLKSGTKEQNPTATVVVIEQDGKPLLFVPVFAVLQVAYLGFNPEAGNRERIAAMEKMLEVLRNFASMFGINQIEVLSKQGYPVAKWAEHHQFNCEERQLFTHKVKEDVL